jgi:two-component system KDP operon response regulator KdpE
MTRVLIVDDDRQIRRALSLNFGARHYEVVEAATGESALRAIAESHPDVVLLDLGLPGMGGLAVIEATRGWSTVPIIVLTARDDERSKVRALDLGADDYVTKPFGMAELLARVRAALRRSTDAPGAVEKVTTSGFELDPVAHRAFVVDGAGEHVEVHLTPTEWNIVVQLVRHPGRLVTYRQLLTAVWGPGYEPDHNLLRVHMANIRRKLEIDPSGRHHFVTEPGVGYRFEAPEDDQ